MYRTVKLLIAMLAASLALSACFSQPPTSGQDEMVPVGPDLKADLVIYFKTGTTSEEIYKFSTETISTPEERGDRSLPGIWQVLYLLPVDGHEGYAVDFFPEATYEQREYVKARVKASPIVYKVMENVVPKEIKKID
jgi:hypothetical protein